MSREHVRRSVDASLTRLGRDWIDLSVLRDLDARTSIQETLTALDELVRAGKVRELGVAAMSADRVAEIVEATAELDLRAPVAIVVDHGPHELASEDELLPAVDELGLGAIATTPLAGGLLVRPDRDAPTDPNDRVERLRDRLDDLARHHGRDLVDLVLSWTVTRPPITAAVTGARTVEQVTRLGAVGTLPLVELLIAELDERIRSLADEG